ncbi:MAG TPA: hypothetical protein VFR65_01880 [Nitrososphaeraceae archaeon]|jgi:EamA domain-containing membrane protein RarD|nr:hypothetical protein [Nitrososphaeraceae archaeon]
MWSSNEKDLINIRHLGYTINPKLALDSFVLLFVVCTTFLRESLRRCGAIAI